VTSILTPRLELVSLSPEFHRASLEGRGEEAAMLLGARLPPDWPASAARVLRRRLAQLEADPAEQPWLLRAMLLRPHAIPEGKTSSSGSVSGDRPAIERVRPVIGVIGFTNRRTPAAPSKSATASNHHTADEATQPKPSRRSSRGLHARTASTPSRRA
jgi:hypothetical protein